ncbi:MAG: GerMN domain-containing protein, partial [Acidobacteriota bacterium]
TAVALVAVVIPLTFWFLRQSVPVSDGDGSARAAWQVEETTSPAAEASPPEAEQRIQVTLYMLSRSGTTLVAEEREVPFASSLQEQAKLVVRELLAGSRRGRASPFPKGVKLRELFITPQGLAFVDLSREVISNHPGGSSGEELTVYSLSNTLIANFPAVKKVQILVEGREVQSLAGHLDLTLPYGRGPRWLIQGGPSSSGA